MGLSESCRLEPSPSFFPPASSARERIPCMRSPGGVGVVDGYDCDWIAAVF